MTRRHLNIVLLFGAIAIAIPYQPARAEPAARSIHVIDFDWMDSLRSRAVPVRLYWPVSFASGERLPLVVFSHGIGGSRQGYSYLGKHWAARGVASLHVQHVGSDASLWRGNPFSLVGRLQGAAQEKEAAARVGDVRFALDRLLANNTPYGALVDRRRIVAAGHSYGANTTLLAVGAHVVRDGRWIENRDPRFTAAIVISAPPFYGEPDLAAVLGEITVPSLHVTATGDVIELPGYYSGAADRLAVFNAIATPRKLLAVFQGGSHSMFTDRAFTGGPGLNPKVKDATADLALAFFDLAFDGNGTALTQWNTAWRAILARPPALMAPPAPTSPSGKGLQKSHFGNAAATPN